MMTIVQTQPAFSLTASRDMPDAQINTMLILKGLKPFLYNATCTNIFV